MDCFLGRKNYIFYFDFGFSCVVIVGCGIVIGNVLFW